MSAPPPIVDLVIVHAPGDAGFVHGYLLPALGLPAELVRVVGADQLDPAAMTELVRVLERTRVFLVVVTSAFLAHPFAQLTEQWALHVATAAERAIIPLFLEDCQPPLHLRTGVDLKLFRSDEWEEQLDRLRKLLDQPPPLEVELSCPYPGMRPFQAADAAHFHGRDRELGELVRKLGAGERELLILGPSGSGKSSLLFAGLLPRLEGGAPATPGSREPLEVRTFRPGEQPMLRLARALEHAALAAAPSDRDDAGAALAAALTTAVDRILAPSSSSSSPSPPSSPPAARLLLVIDQLEELFSLASPLEQQRFAAAIAALRREPRCTLLFTLRADFFAELMQSPLWREGGVPHVDVAPLRGEGLRAAIERPARDTGVYLEPALVERLLADCDSPGALPLMQQVLVELWKLRRRRFLPLAVYQAFARSGVPADASAAPADAPPAPRSGLAVAVAGCADRCLSALSAEQQRIARRVLLRLISFGEGRPDTRRQLPVFALRGGEALADFDATLGALTAARLLVKDAAPALAATTPELDDDADRVDLAHEALLTAWPPLAEWIKVRRADEERRRQLELRTAQWRAMGRGTGGLLDAEELAAARAWRRSEAAAELGESADLAAFLEASEARLERERRRRAHAEHLLATSYRDAGRQLLFDGRPRDAAAYFVAAREQGMESEALRMLFHQALRNPLLGTCAHADLINDYAFSADDALLLTGSRDTTAKLWDTLSGELRLTFAHRDEVLAVWLRDEASPVLTFTSAGEVHRWDLRTGAARGEPRPLPPSLGLAWLARISPHGRWLAAQTEATCVLLDLLATETAPQLLDAGGHVRVFDFALDEQHLITVSDGGLGLLWRTQPDQPVEAIWRLGASAEALPEGPRSEPAEPIPNLNLAMFLGGGERIVTCESGHTLKVWRLDGMHRDLGSPIEQRSISGLASAHRGHVFAAMGDDRTARVWNDRGGEVSPQLRHGADVTAATFSKDDENLATSSLDQTVQLWSVSSGLPLSAPLQHPTAVVGVTFNADDSRLFTVASDHAVRIWDAGSRILRSFGPSSNHARFAVTANWTRLFVLGARQIWSLTTSELVATLDEVPSAAGSSSAPYCLVAAFTPDGERLVTGDSDGAARLWDAATGKLLGAPFQHSAPRGHSTSGVLGLALSRDGALLATVGQEGRFLTPENRGTARVWDLRTGRPVTPLLDDYGAKKHTSVALSLDGRRLVAAGNGSAARLWSVPEGQLLAELPHRLVESACFSPDDRTILTAGQDNFARLWDAATGAPLRSFENADALFGACFDDEGTRILTYGCGNVAKLWDPATGALLIPPLPHRTPILHALFSREGGRIITNSRDGHVRIWDASTAALLLSLDADAASLSGIALSPDGHQLLTGAVGDPVQLWDVATAPGTLEDWKARLERGGYPPFHPTSVPRLSPE